MWSGKRKVVSPEYHTQNPFEMRPCIVGHKVLKCSFKSVLLSTLCSTFGLVRLSQIKDNTEHPYVCQKKVINRFLISCLYRVNTSCFLTPVSSNFSL